MKNIILLCLTFLVFCFNIQITYTCSCAQNEGVENSLEKSTAVFIGKVVKVQEMNQVKNILKYTKFLEATIDVSKSFKGIDQKYTHLVTESSGAACGYNLIPGKEYLIYTYGPVDDMKVSLCSRTQLLSDAREDLIVLGVGKEIEYIDGRDLVKHSINPYYILFLFGFLFIIIRYFYNRFK